MTLTSDYNCCYQHCSFHLTALRVNFVKGRTLRLSAHIVQAVDANMIFWECTCHIPCEAFNDRNSTHSHGGGVDIWLRRQYPIHFEHRPSFSAMETARNCWRWVFKRKRHISRIASDAARCWPKTSHSRHRIFPSIIHKRAVINKTLS